MDRAADLQRFIEALRPIGSPKGLEKLMADLGSEIGFDFVTIYHHADLSRAVPSLTHMSRGELIAISNGPQHWLEQYREENLVFADPRVLAVRRTMSPFRLEDALRWVEPTASQRTFEAARERAGIGDCFTVPAHFPAEPSGSCMFTMKKGRSLPERNLLMAHWLGTCAFQVAREIWLTARKRTSGLGCRRLTERQLECTLLMGQGLSEEAMARRLGISRETVKRHLRDARESYGVSKSVQLVTQAIYSGQLSVRDLFEGGAPNE